MVQLVDPVWLVRLASQDHKVCRDHKEYVDHQGQWVKLVTLVWLGHGVNEEIGVPGGNRARQAHSDRLERKVNVVRRGNVGQWDLKVASDRRVQWEHQVNRVIRDQMVNREALDHADRW